MRFCVSGDSCVWAPFLLSQAHLTIWDWGRLHAGAGGGCCELPCAGDLPLWCVGDGPQRHVSACGTFAWEQEQRVLAMDELWPSLRVHESRGAWVCEDEGPESEGHATWWWRLRYVGLRVYTPSVLLSTCMAHA